MNPLIPDPAAIPELPSPPLFEQLLFENQWLLAVILVVIGLAVCLVMFKAGRRRAGGLTLLIMAVLASVAVLVSTKVVTAREQMEARSRELVRATIEGDTPALREILAENARLTGGFAVIRSAGNREQLLALVESDVQRFSGIDNYRVLEVRAHRDGPNLGRTHVRVRVGQEGGYINFSWWRLDWRDPGDGTWRAVGIEPLWVQGLSR